jgi:hypothetical protein
VTPIDRYVTFMRAGGATPATVRLRRHYLHTLDDRHPAGILAATPADLTAFLAR